MARRKHQEESEPNVNELHFAPNSERQAEFFAADEYEVLYGGASFGGKSMALVMDPMRYVGYEDYTATIFRRTHPQLQLSIYPFCAMYYPHAGGVYNEQKKLWTFPSGAKIRLGSMEHIGDWENYKGDESCAHYFDELTTFHWSQYTGLAPWNRSRAIGIPPYRRSTSNPGGVAHKSVKEYFVDTCPPEKDGERIWSEFAQMWWQPMKPGPTYTWTAENGQKLTRRFIPARAFDNVDGLKKNPNYLAQLLAMDPEKRRALLEGDWNIFEGQFFSMWRDEIHIKDPLTKEFIKEFPKSAIRGVIDYGNNTALEIAFRDFEGNVVNFAECWSESETPTDRAEAMIPTIEAYDLFRLHIECDTNMDIDLKYYYEGAKKPIATFRDVFQKHFGDRSPILTIVNKKSTDANTYRIVCNETMKEFLRWKKRGDGSFEVKPKFYVTRNCRHLIEQLPELVHDPDSPDGLDFYHGREVVDDAFDAAKMALAALRKPVKGRIDTPPKNYEEYAEQEMQKVRERAESSKQSGWDKI
jgi:hypothetical protein